MHASIIEMTLLLPVDHALFDELRADFLPRASQHPGFRGFQYVLADHGKAVGILLYDQPEDLDGITQLAGNWFHDHIAPRLAGPETAVRGRVVVNMTPPHTAMALQRHRRHALRPGSCRRMLETVKHHLETIRQRSVGPPSGRCPTRLLQRGRPCHPGHPARHGLSPSRQG